MGIYYKGTSRNSLERNEFEVRNFTTNTDTMIRLETPKERKSEPNQQFHENNSDNNNNNNDSNNNYNSNHLIQHQRQNSNNNSSAINNHRRQQPSMSSKRDSLKVPMSVRQG